MDAKDKIITGRTITKTRRQEKTAQEPESNIRNADLQSVESPPEASFSLTETTGDSGNTSEPLLQVNESLIGNKPAETDRMSGAKLEIFLHGIEILFPLIVTIYFLLPFIMGNASAFANGKFVSIAIINRINSGNYNLFYNVFSLISYYGIPAISLWKIISVFLSKRLYYVCHPRNLIPMLFSISLSGMVVANLLFDVLQNAANSDYFMAVSPLTYAFFTISFTYNLIFVFLLIMTFNRKNPVYQEYIEFKKIFDKASKTGVFEFIAKSGIQRKLLLSFICLILIIITVLSLTLMSQFKTTVETLIIQNGRALVERAAIVTKTNLGDNIAISEYFNLERKKNESATVKFNSLSFYFKDNKSNSFTVTNTTDVQLSGKKLNEKFKSLTETLTDYDAVNGLYEFITPVLLSNRIIGYISVVYDSKVIFEPHFRSQVRTVSISIFFLYISIIVIYIIGSNIVFPIHSLRMSVHKISHNLSNMIAGKIRVSTDYLTYDDKVKTHDEIKFLSTEFKDMTNVIRGVIPYISTSTLKHAEQTAASMSRDLTFLFTDMRGFTPFCEGLPPHEVVDVLNHYLDLQAGIILKNNGDIDKFIGDEVMAMFEGPEKELHACKASMDIRYAMANENELRHSQNLPTITIGIGINTGPVVFGSVGAKERMDFTSIGDTVNLGARLEGANKSYGTKSLISEAVHNQVKDHFISREIDLLTVKGKTQPVRIYEILQETVKVNNTILQLKKSFEKALIFYRKQKWEEAEKIFKELAKDLNDEPSEVFLNRIKHFKKSPPPEHWDGVFNLTVK